MDNKNHEDSNTFLLTIICHGNKYGHLLDKNKSKAWDTEDFVGDLSEVETLLGKPKIIIIQACRGRMSHFCYFAHYRIVHVKRHKHFLDIFTCVNNILFLLVN